MGYKGVDLAKLSLNFLIRFSTTILAGQTKTAIGKFLQYQYHWFEII